LSIGITYSNRIILSQIIFFTLYNIVKIDCYEILIIEIVQLVYHTESAAVSALVS
jgi:hypothetical protein